MTLKEPPMTPEHVAYLTIGQAMPGTEHSQMFGKPCFKIGGKAFTCFFQNAMVFKLTGPAQAKAIALPGSVLFDPSGTGRAMKEWVQVTGQHQDQWPEFAAAALAYVRPA